MSPAFIAGTAESLPKAQITFDKFHVVKLINEAVDEVCRAEQKSRTELDKNRYRFRDAGTRCGCREVNWAGKTRNRWFESIYLQWRVNELSVPLDEGVFEPPDHPVIC